MASVDSIGLLGGTFNPPHIGHLAVAEDAMEQFHLDAIWFIPCAIPPHKPLMELASDEHRLAMLRLATQHIPRAKVLDVELKRGGATYTIDTIRQLQREYPTYRFHFIIGADTLPELHTWREPLALLAAIPFLILARPGYAPMLEPSAELHLPEPWPERLRRQCRVGRQVDVSSRDIRCRLREHRSIEDFLPEPVYQYIQQHNLYT